MLVTFGFVLAIGLLWLLFLIAAFASRNRPLSESAFARFAAIGPNFLTTIGVFGTFLGILLGLLEFDVTKVDESVPALLDGLKIAFVSSAAGLLGSLLLRFIQPWIGGGGASSDDPIEILGLLLAESKAQSRALSGGEDSSLLTQLQKLRTSFQDGNQAQTQALEEGFRSQVAAFEAFAEKMAENNSQALIDALREVIRDFNEKISEQFGENFKQLNEAVGQLLVWQDQYRAHIEQTEATLKMASDELKASAEALSQVSAAFADAPKTADTVQLLIAEINDHLRFTADIAAGVGDLKSQLSGALPEIQKNISDLTVSFSSAVEKAAGDLSSSANNANEHYAEASRKFSEGVSQLQGTLDQSFQTFDEAMQQELKRALGLMGSQLASISNKLAGDYGDLAENLSTNMRR